MKSAAIVASLALAEGATLKLTYTDCGAAHGKITGLTPDTLPLGSRTTATGLGTVDEAVSAGTFEMDLKASIISQTFTGDLCTAKSFSLPLGTGTIEWDGLKCPVAAGAVNVPVDITLSSSLPAALQSVDLTVKGSSSNGDALLCMDIKTAPATSHIPFKVVGPSCCWSKWGDASKCGDYVGPGAECSTDHSKSCNSANDCPTTPSPSPPSPTPSPPSPAPPTPPSPTPPTPTPPTPTPPSPPSPTPPGPTPGPDAVEACHEAAKNYCTTKGGFCHACQGWGTWGDMFFTAVCNDDVSTCHQPIIASTASGNVTCSCQRAGGCSAGGATCAGPSILV